MIKMIFNMQAKYSFLRTIIYMIGMLIISSQVVGQEDKSDEPDMKPVKKPFTTIVLVDNQTTTSPSKGGLRFIIFHRFSNIDNGVSDLFGIYGASNIKLCLNYGITDRLMASFGYEKNNKSLDFAAKYAILRQTKGGTVPIGLSYYTNMYISALDKERFGTNYKTTNRLAYFHQIIIARRFNKKLSLQVAPSFTHFNAVDSIWTNDKLGLSVGGRYRIKNKVAAIVEYDHSFSVKQLEEYQSEVKPNLAFGVELGTSTHCFQVFMSSYKNICYAHNYAFNQDDFTKSELAVGFNITVRF